MNWQSSLSVVLSLTLGLLLCWCGKLVYGLFHRSTDVNEQLVIKDNAAFAVPLAAYYFSILVCLGAAFAGPQRGGLLKDSALTVGWGLASILLLNIGAKLTRHTLFAGLNPHAEIVDRGNLSAGIVAAGSYIASGLVTLGALSGPSRLVPALALWIYGQVWLMIAVRALPLLLRYDTPPQIARDNRAVALSTAGALIAVGNILRLALTAVPPDPSAAIALVTGYAALGVALLPLCCEAAQFLLWRGFTARHELLEQDKPNAGVGFLLGLFYIGASVLVGWCL
jgi:uncharacterized membrane protein YjfL (UPF0719 family)